MIKSAFLNNQIEKTACQRRTTPFLRRLVLGVVDQVANEHYGDDYARKCLQTSVAIQMLLDRFGISSTLWIGAACFAEVYENTNEGAWGGFWDDGHHVWLVGQFGGLIDLSITQKHRHYRCPRPDEIPIPAIWWDNPARLPPVIRYLPDSMIRIGLPNPADQRDLVLFKAKVADCIERILRDGEVEQINYGPIIDSLETMEHLRRQGHPWLVRAIKFKSQGIPFPEWIVTREQEIIAAQQFGRLVPSRLFPAPA